jgi:hypothetical protein
LPKAAVSDLLASFHPLVAVATSFSAFGIFDGHGGKPAATYASKELLPMVMRLVDRCIEGNSSSGSHSSFSRQASAAAAAAAAGDGLDVDAEGDEAWGIEVTDEDRAVWAAQEALVDRLPKVRLASFLVHVIYVEKILRCVIRHPEWCCDNHHSLVQAHNLGAAFPCMLGPHALCMLNPNTPPTLQSL